MRGIKITLAKSKSFNDLSILKKFLTLSITHKREQGKEVAESMSNKFVESYKEYVNNGSDIDTAFYAVALLIAIFGTIEDLRELVRTHNVEHNKFWEEIINEQSTTTV